MLSVSEPCSVRCFEYDKKRCVGLRLRLRLSLPGRRLSWLIEFSWSRLEYGRSSSCHSLCFLLEFIPCNHVPLPITRSCLLNNDLARGLFRCQLRHYIRQPNRRLMSPLRCQTIGDLACFSSAVASWKPILGLAQLT
jgi:hypothetical protein